MHILNYSDARALFLGIAQLIPVFLIAFFVLDNSWVRKSAEDARVESIAVLVQAQSVIQARSAAQGLITESLRDLEEMDAMVSVAEAEASQATEEERDAIKEARERLEHKRAEVIESVINYQQASQRTEDASSNMTGIAEEWRASAKERAGVYNTTAVLLIILGMIGEILSLWGAVGLTDSIWILVANVSICIALAGVLSILAIDRLISDSTSRFNKSLRQSWAAFLGILLVVNVVWGITSLRIKN